MVYNKVGYVSYVQIVHEQLTKKMKSLGMPFGVLTVVGSALGAVCSSAVPLPSHLKFRGNGRLVLVVLIVVSRK